MQGSKAVPTFRDISVVLLEEWGFGSWFCEVQERIADTERAPPNPPLALTMEMPVLLQDPLNSHIPAPHLLSSMWRAFTHPLGSLHEGRFGMKGTLHALLHFEGQEGPQSSVVFLPLHRTDCRSMMTRWEELLYLMEWRSIDRKSKLRYLCR